MKIVSAEWVFDPLCSAYFRCRASLLCYNLVELGYYKAQNIWCNVMHSVLSDAVKCQSPKKILDVYPYCLCFILFKDLKIFAIWMLHTLVVSHASVDDRTFEQLLRNFFVGIKTYIVFASNGRSAFLLLLARRHLSLHWEKVRKQGQMCSYTFVIQMVVR